MPEGDTIFRAARTLHAALAGQTVTGFTSSLVAVEAQARRLGVVGDTVAAVESRGKHLLVRFSRGSVLHTHLGMHGAWRVGLGAARLPRNARVAIATADAVAVCHGAPRVELLAPAAAERHRTLAALGPDLLGPVFDAATAVRRLQARGDRTIAEALLDQRALAGVGNVFKSETLFLAGLDPFTPVAALSEERLAALVATARELLLRNRTGGGRRTTGSARSARLWVYGRAGELCLRCGTPVRRVIQRGDPPRSTFWCPTCQPRAG